MSQGSLEWTSSWVVPSKTTLPSLRTRNFVLSSMPSFGMGSIFAGLLVEAVSGEEEGVLQAMGDQQRRGMGDVALLDDEFDDGGGGDGVEAAGGGVVEDQVGLGDDGAGDGDAAPHASGEFGRELLDGVFELDELERFDHAVVSLFFRDAIFVEAVGDVVFNGEGVEEGGLLEDHADAARGA